MQERKITVIPKKENIKINAQTGRILRKRVCAYARVSTDLEDQKNSFNAQLDEYRTRISSNPNWEFVKLYSDEGISGTSMKRRIGFQEMIDDAVAGKIDLILVKSISRFARNTVDCLQTIRTLRSCNVEVFFDKENLSTNDTKVDIILTFFASFAQEESKSISENVKWGVRKRMLKGQRKMSTKTLIGYSEDDNGNIIVKEDEAALIRRIFNSYIIGDSMTEIASKLNADGIRNKLNKEFTAGDIYRILINEKYCGDLILQKTVVVDFLDHKAVKNDGIVDKVQITDHHEPIISRDDFMYVQAIRKYRKETYSNEGRKDANILSGILYCSHCYRTMKKITQHPGTKFAKFVFTCKQSVRKSISYVDCPSTTTLDYNLAIAAAEEVFRKHYQIPDGFEEFIEETMSFEDGFRDFCLKSKTIEAEIADLEIELQELLKKQLEEDDFSKYESEFRRIRNLISDKKESIKRMEKERMESRDQNMDLEKIRRFLNENIVAPSLFKTLVSCVVRKNDGSLRFVLSNTERQWTKAELERVLSLEPSFSSAIEKENKEMRYDVIDLRRENHGI